MILGKSHGCKCHPRVYDFAKPPSPGLIPKPRLSCLPFPNEALLRQLEARTPDLPTMLLCFLCPHLSSIFEAYGFHTHCLGSPFHPLTSTSVVALTQPLPFGLNNCQSLIPGLLSHSCPWSILHPASKLPEVQMGSCHSLPQLLQAHPSLNTSPKLLTKRVT